MKPETILSKNFRAEFEAVIHSHNKEGKRLTYHLTPIESNYTSQGIPDINIMLAGTEFWVELKVWPYQLSPLQISWIIQHERAGGLVFIVTRQPECYVVNFTHEVRFNSLNETVNFIINTILANQEN